MKDIILIFALLLIVGCKENESLSSRINHTINSEVVSSATIVDDLKYRLGLVDDCVYLIYSFDSGCSACLAEFYNVINETNVCEHDSMVVVANGAFDRLIIDHYAAETKTDIQNRCRIVCDKNGNITRSIENNYGMNIIVSIGDQILLIDDTHLYEQNQSGFTRIN